MSSKPTVTIDHCCLIALENHEREDCAGCVENIIHAWKCGRIDLAVCAIGATENTKDYFPVKDYEDFKQRLESSGLGCVSEIVPFFRLGASFLGHAKLHSRETEYLEKQIWNILFPNHEWEPHFNQTCENGERTREYAHWVNKLCDVSLVLAHTYSCRDILATSDKLLIRGQDELRGLVDIGKIMTPCECSDLFDLP